MIRTWVGAWPNACSSRARGTRSRFAVAVSSCAMRSRSSTRGRARAPPSVPVPHDLDLAPNLPRQLRSNDRQRRAVCEHAKAALCILRDRLRRVARFEALRLITWQRKRLRAGRRLAQSRRRSAVRVSMFTSLRSAASSRAATCGRGASRFDGSTPNTSEGSPRAPCKWRFARPQRKRRTPGA